MRTETLIPVFVESIPDDLEEGIIYDKSEKKANLL